MTHADLVQELPLIDLVTRWVADKAGVPAADISAETQILGGQMLDSLQLMDFVFYLEESQDVKIPLEWLTPENFATPQTIVDMVERAGS